METMNNLQELKYSELRKIAKSVGIKANLKQEKLLKLLQEHYQKSEISKPVTPVISSGKKNSEKKQTPKENSRNSVIEDHDSSKSNYKLSTADVDSASTTPDITSHIESSNHFNTTDDNTPDITNQKHCRVSANDSSGEVTFNTDGRKRKRTESCSSADRKSLNKKSSKIPRLETAEVVGKKDVKRKIKTPDWKKIHNKNFSRLESIDDYVNRKNKRAGVISNSLKKVRQLVDETNAAVKKLKDNKTPVISKVGTSASGMKKPSTFKPTVLTTKEANFNFNKKTSLPKSPFRPPSRNDFKFTKTGKKTVNTLITPVTHREKSTGTNSSKPPFRPQSRNDSKRKTIEKSKINNLKTPSANREEPTCKSSTQTSRPPSRNDSRFQTVEKNKLNDMKTPLTHRGESAGKSSTRTSSNSKIVRGSLPSAKGSKLPGSASCVNQNRTFSHSKPDKTLLSQTKTEKSEKKAFDLKSSLAKPVTWKPHKGKLKPLDMNSLYKSANQAERIKKARLQERESLVKRRQERKFEKQMENRAIVKVK